MSVAGRPKTGEGGGSGPIDGAAAPHREPAACTRPRTVACRMFAGTRRTSITTNKQELIRPLFVDRPWEKRVFIDTCTALYHCACACLDAARRATITIPSIRYIPVQRRTCALLPQLLCTYKSCQPLQRLHSRSAYHRVPNLSHGKKQKPILVVAIAAHLSTPAKRVPLSAPSKCIVAWQILLRANMFW